MPRSKIVLLQNTIAPYRIPLFERLARDGRIDFILFLMARERPNYPQWAGLIDKLKVETVLVPGLNIRVSSRTQICINPDLLRALVRARPDVIITNGFPANLFWVLLYKFLWRKRLIVWSEMTETSERYLRFYALRRALRRFVVRYVDAFIDAGTLSRAYLRALLPAGRSKRFARAFNAIDRERFQRDIAAFRADDAAVAAFRARFPAQNILFTGQLVDAKNIPRLIEAYAALRKIHDKPVGLIILGQGEMMKYIEEKKKELSLEYLFTEGFIGPDDYYKYFSISDVFLLLSKFDRNPLVIFEALAAGLPIVCSDRAGNAVDFVHNDVNGYVVDPEDTPRTAELLKRLLEDEDLRRGLGATSLQQAMRADYDDAAAAFVEVIEAVSEC